MAAQTTEKSENPSTPMRDPIQVRRLPVQLHGDDRRVIARPFILGTQRIRTLFSRLAKLSEEQVHTLLKQVEASYHNRHGHLLKLFAEHYHGGAAMIAFSNGWTNERKLLAGAYLTMDLEMITPTALDWDKDGDLDLIVGDEDGRVAFIENTGQLSAGRVPQFLAPRYFQQEADTLKFGALATPVGVDWDGDGDTDILSGNTAGYIGFFENLSGPKIAQPKWAAAKRLDAGGKTLRIMAGPNGSIQGPCEAKWGYTTLSVADWDGDGLPDLLVNSILGKVVWYRNAGTRSAPKLTAAQPIEVEWQGLPPTLAYGWLRPEGKALLTQWRTTPVGIDWNKDGLTDLVMLDQEGYLAFFERTKRDGQLVLLAPVRTFCAAPKSGTAASKLPEKTPITMMPGEPLRLNSGIAGKSGRRKLCATDWDGDGRVDLLLNSANANVLRQTSAAGGKWFFQDLGLIAETNIEGHDVSPTVVDFDGDGVMDFLGGAEDGRFYFLKNPRTK